MTNVHEIADGIFRLSTYIPESVIGIPGGFTFNQFLIKDEDPLLFHTGPRRMFPMVREAAARVLPVEKLRWIARYGGGERSGHGEHVRDAGQTPETHGSAK